VDLRRDDGEIVLVILDEVPGIGRQLVFETFEKPRRPEEVQVLVSAQTQPEQLVEPDEMVHVGVRHEDVVDLQELARRQAVQVPEIEQEGRAAVLALHVNPGVSERIVDECGAVHRYTLPLPPGAPAGEKRCGVRALR